MPDADSVFVSFSETTASLRSKLGPKDKQNQQLLSQIDESVTYLREMVASGELRPVPEQYLKSLALDADLLAELAVQPRPQSDDQRKNFRERLETAADDLAIKVSHLRNPRKGPAMVEVTVRARMNGQEANDYEVWFVPKGWANKDAIFKRFDRLTNQYNPPRMFLAPGNYFLWLKKSPAKTERQPLTVGGDGSSKREVELQIH